MTCETLLKKEMRKAIFRSKPDKASGIDEMSNRFLRLIIEELITKITYLFQIYFTIDYHLKKFKKINIIILRKFKKNDYSKFKVYKSIVFLSTLSKAFKTIIIIRFNDYIEKNNLLLSKQMRTHKKRFIETILKIIINAIHIV